LGVYVSKLGLPCRSCCGEQDGDESGAITNHGCGGFSPSFFRN
jgi:hypothetical protein